MRTRRVDRAAMWSLLVVLATPALGCASDVEPPTRATARTEKAAPVETPTPTPAPAEPSPPAPAEPPAPAATAAPTPAEKPAVHGPQVLDVSYQVQQTEYWCGPAATRVAVSARQPAPSQAQLASDLGTTVNGTDYIGQVTRVLNKYVGGYQTREMANDPPLPTERDALWNDIVRDIDNDRVVVANIVAPPSNHPPGYPNTTIYHYIAVIGYNPDTREVYIADSADFGGNKLYWIPFDQLATLIPPKGYSAWFP